MSLCFLTPAVFFVLSLQVVAGFRFKMKFDMQKTICAKAEHKELSKLCIPNENDLVNIKRK